MLKKKRSRKVSPPKKRVSQEVHVTEDMKKKVLIYVAGALLVLALTAVGQLINKERHWLQVVSEKEAVTQAALLKIQATETYYQSKLTSARTEAATYKRKVAKLLNGQVVYDEEEGTTSNTEAVLQQLTEVRTQLDQLTTENTSLARENLTLKEKSSKAGREPYSFGVGYQQAYSSLSDWETASYAAGLGYEFPFSQLTISVKALVGYQLFNLNAAPAPTCEFQVWLQP